MKFVRKQPEPEWFSLWKNGDSPDWSPSYAALEGRTRRQLLDALLQEQGSVCCYCGRGINADDSHIEHFRPQHAYRNLDVDYSNLHASCIKHTVRKLPLHCGHAKGERFDEGLTISPLDQACEARFSYTLNGKIFPENPDDIQARYMIELLQLENAVLRNRREDVLRRVFDSAFLQTATVNELRTLALVYCESDANGQLQGFGHVVARFAEKLIGE